MATASKTALIRTASAILPVPIPGQLVLPRGSFLETVLITATTMAMALWTAMTMAV
jgi:hypothetical protein